VPDVLYFDLMGVILRSHFDDHFDRIGPYFANAHIAYRDLEIVATSKDFGYSTMIQRYWGTSTDGHDFDFTFRITGLLRKKEGKWKWVHEHVSFPVDMVTQKGDFTCGLDASTSLYLERKE
jgi:ketosteroid isomerase-like protein